MVEFAQRPRSPLERGETETLMLSLNIATVCLISCLLQGNLPDPGMNPRLLPLQADFLYHLSHQGRPMYLLPGAHV